MPGMYPDPNYPTPAECDSVAGTWTAQGCRNNAEYTADQIARMCAGENILHASGWRSPAGTTACPAPAPAGTAPAPAAPSSPGDWTAQNTTSVIGTGVQALLGGIGLGLQADAASQQRRFQQAQLEMQNQLAQRNLQFQQAQLAAAAAVPGSAEATQATAVAQQIAQQMVLVQQQMAAAVAARNAAATGPSAGTIALVAGGVAVAGLLLLVVTRRNDPAPRYNPSRRRR